MEIKDMFDPVVKRDIIDRINRLTPQTQHKWGKMDVAQMLTHVQLPINCAYGTHQVKGSFILKLLGPLFKGILYNEKPYKQSLPTDPTYIVVDSKDFEAGVALSSRVHYMLLGEFVLANCELRSPAINAIRP